MLIYDLEIIRSPKFDPKRPNYKYALGWQDYVGMGIACIGWYDYQTGKSGCNKMDWMEGPDIADIEENKRLFDMFTSADLVIGYNNHKFDDPMMRAHGIAISEFKSYDILTNIYAAVGLSGSWDYKTHGGFSLGAVCEANGIEGKSGNGADAPFDWQDGKYEEVMNYCLHDVNPMTKGLVDKIFCDGGLINPKTKKFVRMAIPWME